MNLIDKNYFSQIVAFSQSLLIDDEKFIMELHAEETTFIRFNASKVRQPSFVQQSQVVIKFYKLNRIMTIQIPISTQLELDQAIIKKELLDCREWVARLPEDPFLVLPKDQEKSDVETDSYLPTDEEIFDILFHTLEGYDFVGLLCSGFVIKGNANSFGSFHWFKSASYFLDYSIYNNQKKAVKELVSGSKWDAKEVEISIKRALEKLRILSITSKHIERGSYDVYFEPAAVENLLQISSWSGYSISMHKKGKGCFSQLLEGKKSLSPLFTLVEDFSLGLRQRFNSFGQLAPEKLTIIEQGQYKNFLVNDRTAKEYHLTSNVANLYESLRSPILQEGLLKESNILTTLNKGIYISNLHYLNWSDRATARVTGMTRFACFWVENGQIVSPIKDLRFDETLYHIFGDGLEAVTEFSNVIAATRTYNERNIGASRVPGFLVRDFKFTL